MLLFGTPRKYVRGWVKNYPHSGCRIYFNQHLEKTDTSFSTSPCFSTHFVHLSSSFRIPLLKNVLGWAASHEYEISQNDECFRVVSKLFNIFQLQGMNHHQFKDFLIDTEFGYGDILYCTKIRCLGLGQTLRCVYDLESEVELFQE
jgi:hypothetical protein